MTITTQQKAGCELAAPQVEGGEASIMAATNAAFTNSEEKCTIPLISHEDIALNLASKNSKSFHTHFETSQSFTLLNDDLRVLVSGYQVDKVGTLLYRLLGFITLGTAFLLGKWFPKFPIRLGARPSLLTTASFVVITDQHGQFTKVPIEIRTYDGDFEQLFYSQSTCSDTKGFSLGHSGSIRLFQYRFMIFVLNPETGVFHQLSQWQDNRWAHISRWHEGLDADELKARKTIFPTNVVDIPERPILALLTDEVLHPFVMFQVFSIILWCIEKYYKYAVAITIITSFSVVMTLIQMRSNFKRVQKLSRFECTVNVFRGGTWGTVSSSELVPGDLLDIAHPELDVFPCDSVLIQGDCIVGEGMLTGESVPVSKSPLDRPQLLFEELGANQRGLSNFSPALSRSMLFSGTQLIRARGGFAPPSVGRGREFRAVAMVIRTGFNTTKGGLVRSILFPKPTQFKFYRDSFRFIAVGALIAMVGFVITLIRLISLRMSPSLIVSRTLDLFTVTIPPALPATMSVGVSFALSRLKDKGVFCIAPTRINVSGRVDLVCFDKTGTLTEEGLDVLGAQDVSQKQLGKLQTDAPALSTPSGLPLSLLHCMAACHNIKVVAGERIGDTLDLRMLEATGWVLEEGGAAAVEQPSAQLVGALVRPPHQHRFSLDTLQDPRKAEGYQELAVLNTFEFVASLRRMSVVVKRWRFPSVLLYTKGAPEVIATLCQPNSLPTDYSTQLKAYTQKGYRVIACAGRDLGELTWPQVQAIERDEAESKLTFLGFVVFENRLKAATPAAIASLHRAGIRQVMCTGDNPLTAVSVAAGCGIISQDALIFMPRLQGPYVLWESVNHDRLGDYSAAPLILDPDTLLPLHAHRNDYALVVTGDCFRHVMDNAPQLVVDRMLATAQVFARMSPEEKQELVEHLQRLDYCVTFCGDGANDCGALRAADVGLSLSEAEASVAAPFTSKVLDISSVPLLVREGRGALVTSFSCFKYMGLYSIIQSTSIMFLYQYGSTLGDNQFLVIDLFTILPIAITMGRTAASSTLYPGSPSASLISKKTLVSFVGQCIIQILFLLAIYLCLITEDWFVSPEFDPEKPGISSMINTTLFHLSSFQYIWGALVFSVGHPFRRPMYTNLPFVVVAAALAALYAWILLRPNDYFKDTFELVSIPDRFRHVILAFAAGNLLVSYAYERYLAPLLVRFFKLLQRWFTRMTPSLSQRRRTGARMLDDPKKKYQQVQQEVLRLAHA